MLNCSSSKFLSFLLENAWLLQLQILLSAAKILSTSAPNSSSFCCKKLEHINYKMFLLCLQKTWAPQLQNSSLCLQKAQALATKFHFLLHANEERRGWICNLPGAVSHLHIHLGFAQQHQAWDAFQNVPPKLGFLPGTSSAATLGLHPPSPLLLFRFLLLYVSSLPESCLPAAAK